MSAVSFPALKVDFRRTQPRRHLLIPRALSGLPLLGIGLMHLAADGYGMRPLVEAANLPFAAVLSPVAVAAEILAGLSLLLGAWVRVGAALAILTMAVAVYAHLAINVWPNDGGEPTVALPLLVLVCAAYLLWHGAGRWSVDAQNHSPT